MGNPLSKEIEEKAKEQLRALGPEAKEWLNHHIRNSLGGASGYAQMTKRVAHRSPANMDRIEEYACLIESCIDHIIEDLHNALGA